MALSNAFVEKKSPAMTSEQAVTALIPLLITFILGTLCLQGFNLVFEQVGQAVGAGSQASMITAIPGIVLGIVCFVYGSLGDFVSLRKLVTIGIVTLLLVRFSALLLDTSSILMCGLLFLLASCKPQVNRLRVLHSLL